MTTTDVSEIAVPEIDAIGIELLPPHGVKLKGTITRKEPAQDLESFFRSIHRNAVAAGASEVRVDVSELSFVNSSAIRLFVDWATWVKSEPSDRYRLRFLTNPKVTWQRTSFTALLSLMKDVLFVERVD